MTNLAGEAGKKFSYRDIKNVYKIVLFEKSPKEFHEYPETYRHFFEQKSDTGLKLELLQKYVLIPLDIFVKNQHNRDITGRREAWLTLLACDEPEKIMELVEKYPEFRPIYEEGYELCRNTERVMEMFSKELYELDRNTVQYMIDEQQEMLDAQREELDAQRQEISQQRKTIDNMYKGTIDILRSFNVPDQEIIQKLCTQYQLDEAEARKYL